MLGQLRERYDLKVLAQVSELAGGFPPYSGSRDRSARAGKVVIHQNPGHPRGERPRYGENAGGMQRAKSRFTHVALRSGNTRNRGGSADVHRQKL